MKKQGFTLAEMLIAMGIIGFVAALTIPALTSGARQQEFKTSYRKAIDTLNRAINVGMTMDNRAPGDLITATSLRDYFAERISIEKTDTLGSNLVFYTTDGMRFEIPPARPTATDRCSATAPCIIIVDVNNTKLPNVTPANINNNVVTDRFSIGITDSAAMPNGQTAINAMSRSN